MELAPILVSVFDRFEHFHKCIDALRLNDIASQSILYIASDAPTNPKHFDIVNRIRQYISEIDGFKKVIPIFRDCNLGAFDNIASAFNQVIKEHGRIIFLEDDIITSCNFLTYMNKALDYYKDDKRILTITGYMPPFKVPFFINNWISKRHCAWGFGTWMQKWEQVDISDFNRYGELLKIPGGTKSFNTEGNDMSEMLRYDSEGLIKALDMRICYHLFVKNQFTVYPRISKSNNIGFDGSGIHCGITDYYLIKLDDGNTKIQFDRFMLESFIMRYLYKCYIEKKNKYDFALKPIKKVKRYLKLLTTKLRMC